MRPSYASLAAALVLASAVLPAPSESQQTFQGVVTYDMTTQAGTSRMVQYIKGTSLRVELESQGRQVIMLTDADAARQILLMPERKQWMDLKAMQERMGALAGRVGRAAAPPPAAARGPVEFRATGNRETVAGIACEHFVIVSESGEADVCAAKGLGWHTGSPPSAVTGMGRATGGRGAAPGGDAADAPGGLSALQIAQLRERFADGFFPLKITSTGASGRTVTIQVVELSRKAVEDALFQPPADYQEMRIPGRDRLK